MSARSFIARVAVSAGYSHESAELLVQRALDEHAHELAEKIRGAQFGPEGHTWDWWDAATIPEECAKVIDPEVEQ